MNNSVDIPHEKASVLAVANKPSTRQIKKSEIWRASLRRLLNWKVIVGIALLLDILGITGGVVVADGYCQLEGSRDGSIATLFILFFTGWNLLIFHRTGFYNLKRLGRWPAATLRYATIIILTVAAVLGLHFSQAEALSGWSRWLLAVCVATYLFIWLLRYGFASLMRLGLRKRMLGEDIAVVGDRDSAREFISHLDDYAPADWWNVVGAFNDQHDQISTAAGEVSGGMDELIHQVREGRIQQVVLMLPWHAREQLEELCARLADLPVALSFAFETARLTGRPHHQFEHHTETPMFEINHLPSFGWAGILKWIEDKVLSVILILLFSPLLLLIAVAIKLDGPGPVIFRQVRYGFNKQRINVYKFRTMHHSASEENVFRQAVRNDPRVTRVGRFLRKTSLDELPQLFNVLEGSMSLVGPRPHPIELNDRFTELVQGIEGRHNVKPGITGWAQINGLRGETDTLEKMAARVEYDIEYIERWSLWLDLRILFLTAFKGWVDENAY